MVKYFALVAVVVASLVAVDVAEARGRRGCSSCSAGGCPGGVCALPAGPAVVPAPPKAAAVEGATPVVTTATAPVTYTTNTRRGLFGWRR